MYTHTPTIVFPCSKTNVYQTRLNRHVCIKNFVVMRKTQATDVLTSKGQNSKTTSIHVNGIEGLKDQEISTHLSQNRIAVCLVAHNHSDGTQVIDTVQLLALALHLVANTPQVLWPA